MARRGIMAKEPALRGKARKDFRAAQKSAAASGEAAPTQAQFRPSAAPLRGEFRRDYRKAAQTAKAAGQAAPSQADFRARQQAAQAANRPQPPQNPALKFDGMLPVTSPENIGNGQVGQALNQVIQGGQNGLGGTSADPRAQWVQQQLQQQQSFPPEGRMMYTGATPGFYDQIPPDKMFRFPQPAGGPQMDPGYFNPDLMPQMPQPSRNMGGQYRLSPGVYGSREQAMQQYNQQMQQRGVQNAVNGSGQMPDFSRFGPIVPQVRRG